MGLLSNNEINSALVSLDGWIYSDNQIIKSFSFDKESSYEGILTGIKGQYLIFKENMVLNIRKHTGYNIRLDY